VKVGNVICVSGEKFSVNKHFFIVRHEKYKDLIWGCVIHYGSLIIFAGAKDNLPAGIYHSGKKIFIRSH